MANSLIGSSVAPSDTGDVQKTVSQVLHVCAIGFSTADMKLIASVVMLSQRRSPRLKLMSLEEASGAEVFLIDGGSQEALEWVVTNEWIRGRCVIWVRSSALVRGGEMVLHPPILWSQLTIKIVQALEEQRRGSAMRTADAPAGPRPGHVDFLIEEVKPIHSVQSKPKILVVDDSPTVRQHLRFLLQSYDLAVDEAEDGYVAMDMSAADAYECVLLDVLMPGMDGYETCRKIKARAKTLGRKIPPVIMLTSKGSPFDRIRGKMSGCNAYLTKPVGLDNLLQELSKHVEMRI